ncbi:MAG: glutaredoxin family protein [Isosphaeraceae bacterium]
MIAKLARLLRRTPDASFLTFTVYTRHGCSCCHKALDLLGEFRSRYGFSIETIDVDTDPALVEAHGTSVPVVTLRGKVRFRGQVNPALLERLIVAEASQPAD